MQRSRKGGFLDTGLVTKLMIVVVALFAVRVLIAHFCNPTVYSGPYYKIKIPTGWEMKEKGDDEVMFLSPEKDEYTGAPQAIFSIYGYKSKGALFEEDFFPEVLEELANTPGKLIDSGDIGIADDVIAKYTLFETKDPKYVLLTIYIIDDFNRLTKLQYLSKPEYHSVYLQNFYDFKAGLKIKGFF